MLFDTHTHLNAEQFHEDVEDVIVRAQEAGVSEMIVVGFDHKTIEGAISLVERYDFLYAAVGWHPVDAIEMNENDLNWIEDLCPHPKVVALGETGLDYHWDKSPKEVQKTVFRQQIQLAKKVNLPLIIHNREATEDVIAILKEEGADEVGGIMHCFSSTLEDAKACIDLNFYISIGGPVTFKNAKQLKEVVAKLPLERLLIETDCPYLAPHPFRGKRNEPAYVKYVAEQIALLKGIDYQELAQKTSDNAKQLFGIN
ncbi:hydrolase TatD [Pueribacillus theae]|uniref:Hydrolase TatD n=1 Tax=Pueribacillus theae TaxID=2171751 RepID=A0A2U1K541_9BACI|nr:TatD family hydrolase [Pueribacillus theae]PWA12113.1 hydrolase TatD [Pueribacillus theae]